LALAKIDALVDVLYLIHIRSNLSYDTHVTSVAALFITAQEVLLIVKVVATYAIGKDRNRNEMGAPLEDICRGSVALRRCFALDN
jgi:hypothetical protein